MFIKCVAKKGFRWKVIFVVNEVSFENVTKDLFFSCFWKWWQVQLSLYVRFFFAFVMCLLGFRLKIRFLWLKLVFKLLLKWWVFLMFLKMVKSAILCGCPCCFVFHLSCSKNCLEKILQHVVLMAACDMTVIGIILCFNSFISNNCSLNWVFIECVAKGLDEKWTFLWMN